jgi:hypothetical protein
MRRMRIPIPMSMLLVALVSAAALAAPVEDAAGEAGGKVLFKVSGGPVPQAIVEFASASHQARAVTLDDGTFHIPKLATGTYTVTVSFRGQAFIFPKTQAGKGLVFRI